MEHEKKYRMIGITGGIGSGKSTIGEMLESRDFYVIDTDKISRDLTSPGKPLLDEISRIFGPDVIRGDGSLDRAKVASLVFSSDDNLSRLEAILHPAIIAETIRLAEESNREMVFTLIPLLFEAGLEDMVDEIWLCYVDRETRIKRVMQRDGVSREDVIARMDSQIPDELKLPCSDFVFDMSGTLSDVEEQLERVLERLK